MFREIPEYARFSRFVVALPVATVTDKASDISRGSVATWLKCGGICNDNFITNLLLRLQANEY